MDEPRDATNQSLNATSWNEMSHVINVCGESQQYEKQELKSCTMNNSLIQRVFLTVGIKLKCRGQLFQ